MFRTQPTRIRQHHLAAAVFIVTIVLAGHVPLGFAADLVMEFGGTGSADGEFLEINGVAVGLDGRIYVVDAGNARVQVFNPDGSFAYSFGEPGTGEGEFDFGVCGITVNDDLERIYVSEGIPGGLNHRVQAFGIEGDFLFEFGTQGSGAGEFESPCQMAIGPDAELFVVDRGNDRVQVFGPVGDYLTQFGTSGTGDGQFTLPSGIAIDYSGQVFVADSFNPRIQVFDYSGSFIQTFGSFGTGSGEFDRPCHLAQGGTLMVADALNERIQVFTLAGNYQLEFPVMGTAQSIFCSNVPTGLATDRLGRIYVEEGDFVRVYSIDRDGDGLLDVWETNGVDLDADGTVDLPIHEPPYNADPDHKDLYIEFDWHMRSPVASHVVREMKQTLCAAPVYAGGLDNPDGEPGIRLHVDTGTLTDPMASERLQIPCSCRDGTDNNGDGLMDSADPSCMALDPSGGEGGAGLVTCDDDIDNDGDGDVDAADSDCPKIYDEFATEYTPAAAECDDGIDNDGDGAIDAADPDCAVGDDLGGGTVLVDTAGDPFTGDICDLDSDFYAAKALNFDPVRALVFRYALQAPNCDLDGDGDGDTRSKAEVGGNDTLHSTLEASAIPAGALLSAASYVHELGHNLRLTHGGFDANNCEPNYVSIMNYDSGTGLRRVVRNVRAGLYDFSPPRFPGGRGNAPLPAGSPAGELDEGDLDERTILDPSNRLHQFVFVNALGVKVQSPLNGDVDGDGVPDGVDWNGDESVTNASGLMINLDTWGASETPAECYNETLEILTGYNDWFNLSLPFRQFGDLADGPVNPTETPEPAREELIALEMALNTTDLSLELWAAASPVEAGDAAVITATTSNFGPNPASRAAVVLETGGTPLLLPPACAEGAGTVDCEFGPVAAGSAADLTLTFGQEAHCSAGLPTPIGIDATVENVSEFAGPDPDGANNVASLVVETVDSTPPTVDCNVPEGISPPQAPVAIAAIVEDSCDDAPMIAITGVQCYGLNQAGVRYDLPCRVESEGGTLTIRRTGGVGSFIEWTVETADASGNAAAAQCQLTVSSP